MACVLAAQQEANDEMMPVTIVKNVLSHVNSNKHLELSRLCNSFIDAPDNVSLIDEYHISSEQAFGKVEEPITDICIIAGKDKPPEGYILVAKSPNGNRAILNRGAGGANVYMCYQRGGDKRPITAISIIFTDMDEENPLGFKQITSTPNNSSACLNRSANGKSVFLCVLRGDSSPLTDITVIFPGLKEDTPRGFRRVSYTPRGRDANINSGTEGDMVYICFRQDYSSLFQPLLDISSFNTHVRYEKTISCLLFSCYHCDTGILKEIFRCFQNIRVSTVPPHLINIFISSICSLIPCIHSCVVRSVFISFLHELGPMIAKFIDHITPATLVRVFQICFFLRKQDRNELASQSLIDILQLRLSRLNPCSLCNNHQPPTENSIKTCHRCKIRANELADSNSNSISFCKSIVTTITSWVELGKSTELYLNIFQRHHIFDIDFADDVSELISQVFLDRNEQLFFSVFLVLCKQAAEPSLVKFSTDSETMKRKAHALRLLAHVLSRSNRLFRDHSPSLLILRRFFIPSLLDASMSMILNVFRLVLRLFALTWQHYRQLLIVELGVLKHVFLGLLASPTVPCTQKSDIIEMIEMIFRDSQVILDLFYNYDNDPQNSNLFEDTITSISRLIEDPLGDNSESNENQITDNIPSIQQSRLRTKGLETLVKIMGLLSNYLERQVEKKITNSNCLESSKSNLSPDQSEKEVKTTKNETWHIRFDIGKQNKKIMEQAVLIAKTDNLKSSIRYLMRVRYEFQQTNVIAKWLYSTPNLNKVEVGDFLSEESNSLFSITQFNALRRDYMALIDFTGMEFDKALRNFLCDCNFRLPGEAQKIDRLIEVFANAYVAVNPDIFQSSLSAYQVAFALIILNTDLHDPRLGQTGMHRTWTKEEFLKSLRGCENGDQISASFAESMYDRISAHAIEWRSNEDKLVSSRKTLSSSHSISLRKGVSSGIKPLSPLEIQLALEKSDFERESSLLIRKAQATLRQRGFDLSHFHTVRTSDIVNGLWDVSWYRFLAAISYSLETSKNVTTQTICLDGLKYGANISCLLKDSPNRLLQLDAFASYLARFSFIHDKTIENIDSEEIQRRIISGDHLKQRWYSLLRVQALKVPLQAAASVTNAVKETQKRVVFDRNQGILKSLQNEFQGDIGLLDSSRIFIRSATLTKISQKQRHTDYEFFLFNDIFLYTSLSFQSKYKLHRCLHLSFCHVIDIEDTSEIRNAFKIVSPQKTFTVYSRTPEQKTLWVQDIVQAIEHILSERKKFLDKQVYDDITDKEIQRARNISQFTNIFMRSTMFDNENFHRELPRFPEKCKLCMRIFTVLRRKKNCQLCYDALCDTCLIRKYTLPNEKTSKRICCICWGSLTRFGQDVSVLSTGKHEISRSFSRNSLSGSI